MNGTKRKAVIRNHTNKNGRTVYVVSYFLKENNTAEGPMMDFGVYFCQEEAETVKEMIDNGELKITVICD